jgi:hypothetical protein
MRTVHKLLRREWEPLSWGRYHPARLAQIFQYRTNPIRPVLPTTVGTSVEIDDGS